MARVSFQKWLEVCRKNNITNRHEYRAKAKELGLPMDPKNAFGADKFPGFCALIVDTKFRSKNLPDVVEKARNYVVQNGITDLNVVVAAICPEQSKRRGVKNIILNYMALHTDPLRLESDKLMVRKHQVKCTYTLDEAREAIKRLGIKTYQELRARRNEDPRLSIGVYTKYNMTWNEFMGQERRYYCEDLLPKNECVKLFKKKLSQIKKHCKGFTPAMILEGRNIPKEIKAIIYSDKVLTNRFPKKFNTTYGSLPKSTRKELKALWNAA